MAHIPPALAGNHKAELYVRLIDAACSSFSYDGTQTLNSIYELLNATNDPVELGDIFHALVTSDGFVALDEADQMDFAKHFIVADHFRSDDASLTVEINREFVLGCLQPRPALGTVSVVGDLIMQHNPEAYSDTRSTVALLTLAVMHAAAYEHEDQETGVRQQGPSFPCDIKIGMPENATRARLSRNMHDLLSHVAHLVQEPNSLAEALFDEPTADEFGDMLEKVDELQVNVVGRGQDARMTIKAPVSRAQLPAIVMTRSGPSVQERRMRSELLKLRETILGNDALHEHIRSLATALWHQRLKLKHGLVRDVEDQMSQQSRHIFLVAPPGTGKSTSAFKAVLALEAMGLSNPQKRLFLAAHDVAQKYTGWTGQFVAEKFREAAGGAVIFDGFDAIAQINSYGPQAVNAANEEITKPRKPSERPSVFLYTMYDNGPEIINGINSGMRDRVTVIKMERPNGMTLRRILAQQLKDQGLEIGQTELEECGAMMDMVLRTRKAQSGYGRMAEKIAERIAGKISERMFDDGTLSLLETTPAGRLTDDVIARYRTITAADLPIFDEKIGAFVARPRSSDPSPDGEKARSGAATLTETRARKLGLRVIEEEME